MYKILCIIILFISSQCFGQRYPFNDTVWWEKLVYEEKPATSDLSKADTAIIVVSNRFTTKDKLRFMSEVRGNGEMLYFFVYSYKNKWHVLKVKSLEHAIKYMPDKNRDWVVYTEGMGKIFTVEVYRGMMMASQYNVNVIMLDYPSITTTKRQSGNYLFAISNSKDAYKDHTPVLKNIKDHRARGTMGKGNLSLFFHSMGNNMIRQMVRKQKLDGLNDKVWVDNMILNAACVPQHSHIRWVSNIHMAEDIYIQYNPGDRTLYWPEILNKKKQLGRRLRKADSAKAHYVNFGSVVGKEHSYFLSLHNRVYIKPIAKEYYNTILHGKKVDFNNGHFKPSTYRKIGLDIQP